MAAKEDRLPETLRNDPYTGLSDRLYYATGEMLGADDFQAEQLYHRRQLAMTLRFLYGSGTIAGLKVTVEPQAPDSSDPTRHSEIVIVVKPGLAIDRAGRLVEVPVPVSLRLKRWLSYTTNPDATGDPHAPDALTNALNNSTVTADLFLSFHPCERGWTPAFASGPFDSLDASQPSRIRDSYELKLLLRSSGDASTFDPWAASLPDNPSKAQVQEAILDSWDSLLPPANDMGDFHEIPAELKDPAAIRLARLNIPVEHNASVLQVADLDWRITAWSKQPSSSADNTRNVDNTARNFIVPPAILRRIHNL
jgi:hypothetical protein